jgi:putative tryptophan/tyrosine transport system substrate-binding protein
MIGRRDFLTLLGAAAWPVAARAQQPALPVIGLLSAGLAPGNVANLAAFRRGLEETGYVEGRNVAVEYRWADGHYDRLPELAADLIDRKVAVIAASGGSDPALVAKALTTTIPIVFEMGADPVAVGLVPSLARPGGNVTGAVILSVELMPKRLELLQEVLPGSAIAALLNPTSPINESEAKDLQQAARTLGLQLQILHASTDQEIGSAFEMLVRLRAGGLVIGPDPFFRSQKLAMLCLRYAVPAIHQFRDFAEAGGLMSYGAPLTDAYHLVGTYTGRILSGEKPANLPVQQSTRAELVMNLKTAKALGLTIPLTLLGRADEVIE